MNRSSRKRYRILTVVLVVVLGAQGVGVSSASAAMTKFELYMKIKELECRRACEVEGKDGPWRENCYREKRADLLDRRNAVEIATGIMIFEEMYQSYRRRYRDPRQVEKAMLRKFIPFREKEARRVLPTLSLASTKRDLPSITKGENPLRLEAPAILEETTVSEPVVVRKPAGREVPLVRETPFVQVRAKAIAELAAEVKRARKQEAALRDEMKVLTKPAVHKKAEAPAKPVVVKKIPAPVKLAGKKAPVPQVRFIPLVQPGAPLKPQGGFFLPIIPLFD